MKRLILLLCILVFVPPCESRAQMCVDDTQLARLNPAMVGGSVPVEVSPCPSGTNYISAWNGDYTADTDKICYNSKASQKDGTTSGTVELSTDYGRSGYGFRVTAKDEYLLWAVSSDDLIDDSLGTVCIDVYYDDEAFNTDGMPFEATRDGVGNSAWIRIMASTGSVRGYYYGNSAAQNVQSGTAMSVRTWTTLKYTWDLASDKHKIYVGANGTEAEEDLTAWTDPVSELTLGEKRVGQGGATLWLDNLRIYTTYDATCE